MAYGRRWKPTKAEAREFKETMREIEAFCLEHGIDKSLNGDSYYFSINGQEYRVSNHTVEASNAGAYNWAGYKIREEYHEGGRDKNTIYIHAGKTRIREIYNDLVAGYQLDGRGRRKNKKE